MKQWLARLFKKEQKWEPEHVHNLWENQKGWGWNVYFSDWERRRIVGHHPRRYTWQENNEVRCKMDSGKIARFRIKEFETATGVNDMFFATLEDVGYLDEVRK